MTLPKSNITDIQANLIVDQDATDESVGHIKKGYELHEEVIIECIACKGKLVSVLVVQKDCPCLVIKGHNKTTTLDKIKIRAKCIKCNMLSFAHTFERCKVFYQAIEPFGLNDTKLDENTGSVLVEVK